jgi:alpha-beta hydrolase superfamily lysophospholipase
MAAARLSPVQPTPTPTPAAPQTAVSADGTRLATRHWPSEARAPWASVLIVHGLGEHSGRYEHVSRRLASAGLDVHAVDLRGFGASGGRRAYVDRWSQLHDDVESRLREIRVASDGRPVVLYGHSLGGLVTLGYVLTERPKPDLLVVTAPAIDAAIPRVKRAAARALSRVLPRLEIRNGFDGAVLSRDKTVGERYLADPLNHHGTTARLAGEALAEQGRVRAGLTGLAVPTLVLHGTDDGLVPPAASEPLAGLPTVTRRTYPGLRHELHNEPEWESVMDDVVAWLRERC